MDSSARQRSGAAGGGRRAAVCPADLLRASAALGVEDTASLQVLAHQLGLVRPVVVPAQRVAAAGTARATAAAPLPPNPAQGDDSTRRRQAAAPDTRAPTGDGPPGPAAQARLSALPPLQPATPPAWTAPGAPALARGHPAASRQPAPLFSPQTTRALGAAVAAVQAADGEVDTDRLVAALAAREPLHSLPRHNTWTLRRGLQVLVDTGPGMQPFAADVDQLLAVLRRLLGADRLQVQAFTGEPLHGGLAVDRDGGDRSGWQRPAAGVPVLVLSDLGIARPPGSLPRGAGAWRPFLHTAAQAGHPLRALLPYAPVRWPAGFAGRMQLLCWDRRTTVAAVRRLLAG